MKEHASTPTGKTSNLSSGNEIFERTVQCSFGDVEVSHTRQLSGDKPPVLIHRGFMRGERSSRPLFPLVMERGRPALSMNLHPDARDRSVRVPREFSHVTAHWQRAAAQNEVLQRLEIPHTASISHSEAALIDVLSALQRPEIYSHLVLVNPLGLLRKENPLRLFMSYALNAVQYGLFKLENGETPIGKKMGRDSEKFLHVWQGGIRSVVAQLLGVSSVNIEEWLSRVHAECGIVHACDDVLYPAREVIPAGKRAGAEVQEMRGPHDSIRLKPEETIGRALDLLEELERRVA